MAVPRYYLQADDLIELDHDVQGRQLAHGLPRGFLHGFLDALLGVIEHHLECNGLDLQKNQRNTGNVMLITLKL